MGDGRNWLGKVEDWTGEDGQPNREAEQGGNQAHCSHRTGHTERIWGNLGMDLIIVDEADHTLREKEIRGHEVKRKKWWKQFSEFTAITRMVKGIAAVVRGHLVPLGGRVPLPKLLGNGKHTNGKDGHCLGVFCCRFATLPIWHHCQMSCGSFFFWIHTKSKIWKNMNEREKWRLKWPTNKLGKRCTQSSEIEQSNGIFVNTLGKLCAGKTYDWPKFFNTAHWADRITVKEGTGKTPYSLMFSMECVVPYDLTGRLSLDLIGMM